MGQKVHPVGFRVGFLRTWESRWFARKGYTDWLHEDIKIRHFIKEKLYHAGISRVEIERTSQQVRTNIFTSRPGVIIGRRGAEVENLRRELEEITGKDIRINIHEIKTPELDAQLAAENIALQIERRVSYRRAMKRGVAAALRLGAKGVKICCGGRLGGAEIARKEWIREGRVPLQTLRADIDYGNAEAYTTYGRVGVKVWIFKEEILLKGKETVLPQRELVTSRG